MAVGSEAGHDPPTIPLAPLSAIAVALTLPLTVPFPLQTVPSAATPRNDNCPSSDAPLTVAVMLPDHAIWSPLHVALTDEPFCVTFTVICSDPLFDDANVPRHAPEMSVTMPPPFDVGLAGEPEHAHVAARTTTDRLRRMLLPDHKTQASSERGQKLTFQYRCSDSRSGRKGEFRHEITDSWRRLRTASRQRMYSVVPASNGTATAWGISTSIGLGTLWSAVEQHWTEMRARGKHCGAKCLEL